MVQAADWTLEEIETLKKFSHERIAELVVRLGKPRGVINRKLARLGIPRPTEFPSNKESISGRRFDMLIALEELPSGLRGTDRWLCQCDCGRQSDVWRYNLLRGAVGSCGCRVSKHEDLAGQRFGKLVVIEKLSNNGRKGHSRCRCICDCGREHTPTSTSLKTGKVSSCGRCVRGLSRRTENPGRTTFLRTYKTSARNRNIVVSLTDEELIALSAMDCHYCGSPPASVAKSTHAGADDYVYQGIDRIDNSRGYHVDNVVPCCGYCNRAKINRPASEFLAWLARVVEFRSSTANSTCLPWMRESALQA